MQQAAGSPWAWAGSSGRHVETEDERNSGDLTRRGVMPATDPYKAKPKSEGAASGVGGVHSSKEAGQCPWSEGTLVVPGRKRREARRDCPQGLLNARQSAGTPGNAAPEGRAVCRECLWPRELREPCAGNPHARFDEGELETEFTNHRASSLLYPLKSPASR